MSFNDKQDSTGAASDPLQGFLDWLQKHWKLLAFVVAPIIVVVIAALTTVGWVNNINNEGYEWQRNTLTKYQAVQVDLSTCLDNSLVSAQIAQEERDSLKDTLTGVISARYPTSSDGKIDTQSVGVLISAVQEQYPSIPNDLFKQLMTNAVGCRNQVAGTMKDLQAYAGRFETWTHQGSVYEKQIRDNWPNDLLKVTGLRGETLKGVEAVEFLSQTITTRAAADAIRTHRMPDQQLFPSGSATK